MHFKRFADVRVPAAHGGDFVFTDFNVTHGLAFAGASGTTACANVSDLAYGAVQGRADVLEGSLDKITREQEDDLAITDARTMIADDLKRIAASQVRQPDIVRISTRRSSTLFHTIATRILLPLVRKVPGTPRTLLDQLKIGTARGALVQSHLDLELSQTC